MKLWLPVVFLPLLACEAEDEFVALPPTIEFIRGTTTDSSGEPLTIDNGETFTVRVRATGGLAGNRLETLNIVPDPQIFEPVVINVADAAVEEFEQNLPFTVEFENLTTEVVTTLQYIILNRRGQSDTVSFELTVVPVDVAI